MADSATKAPDSSSKVMKRRMKALKKVQFEIIKTESELDEKIMGIICEYAEKFTPLYKKRKELVSVALEPTDGPSDSEEDDVDEPGDENDEDTKGIPEFWLTIFKNVIKLSCLVQDYDEPILKHLNDINVKRSKSESGGFTCTLEFHFDPNDYFTNSVLTKTYTTSAKLDTDDPFSYDGPECIKFEGCSIDWKPGKDVTLNKVKITQKHKGRGKDRTITKTVHSPSFFNFFFTPPQVSCKTQCAVTVYEAARECLEKDFEIGVFIRDDIVPRALLYFTGEAVDDNQYEKGEEESDDDSGDCI